MYVYVRMCVYKREGVYLCSLSKELLLASWVIHLEVLAYTMYAYNPYLLFLLAILRGEVIVIVSSYS